MLNLRTNCGKWHHPYKVLRETLFPLYYIVYMELAIPLVALGGLFIVSNKDEKKSTGKEGFTTKLPNLDVPDPSPDYVPNATASSQLATMNKYSGSAYTDKYFGAKSNTNKINTDTVYTSINGEKVGADYFSHGNMMPFFGGKLRSSVNPQDNESILDNYLGTGSVQINKSEQSPLFNPKDKLQYAYGAPNNNDFYQSRVNPSMSMNGVKPFQSEQVGPGLCLDANHLGGSGGYNAGAACRDGWMPKNVDQLRTANKQKPSEIMMLGHEGPGKSRITNPGILGEYKKNRPETAWEWGPDRYFTTTGVGQAPTSHAIPVERHVNRPDTTAPYEGVAKSTNSLPLNPGEIMPSHRVENGQSQLGIANANGRGFATEGDFGAKSIQMYMNNRTYNQDEDASGYFGAVKSGIGAVVAPLLEIMRPSRKENVTGNMRVYGGAKPATSQSYLYNPNDAPAPTMRETMEGSDNYLMVNRGQTNNGYLSTPYQAVPQRRDTSTVSYTGVAGYSNSALRPYDAEMSYVPSDMKAQTAGSRFGNGNAKMLNTEVNYQGRPKENDMALNRELMPKKPSQLGGLESFGELQYKQSRVAAGNRNDSYLQDALKQNPYAIKKTF